jgi:hypothetical protein
VAFDPKHDGEKPLPGERPPWRIGFMFLFDRLIPIYKIREEHYAIARYYRRLKPKEFKVALASGKDVFSISLFKWKIPIIPLEESEAQRAESWLTLLRIIGAGLTIFLLAAISALTR